MSNPNCYCRDQIKDCIYCGGAFDIEFARDSIKDLLERLAFVENQPDFLALWRGRPKAKKVRYTRYFFRFKSEGCLHYVHLQPSRFIPIDWRGVL